MNGGRGGSNNLENREDWSDQITNIRAFAILVVVFGHSIIIYSSSWNLYSSINNVPVLDYIKEVINIFQMPVFFSLSGYLFVHTHHKNPGMLKLIKNKLLRLLVPYFLVGFLYMAPIKIIIQYPGYQGKSVKELIFIFLKAGDVGHLWYLPALFFIFIISEILLEVVEKITFLKNWSVLLLFIISIFLYVNGNRFPLGYAPLLSAFSNIIWFASGCLIYTYRKLFDKIYGNSMLKYGCAILGTGWVLWCAYYDTGVVVQCMCTLLFILNLYGLMPGKTNRGIELISKDSFGIYLFHSPLIYITYAFFPDVSPAIVVLLNFVVFGGVALGLTEIVRRLKLGIVIGEDCRKR